MTEERFIEFEGAITFLCLPILPVREIHQQEDDFRIKLIHLVILHQMQRYEV